MMIIPFRIPAKTDIEIRVNAGGACATGATFELWYEDDDTTTTTTTSSPTTTTTTV